MRSWGLLVMFAVGCKDPPPAVVDRPAAEERTEDVSAPPSKRYAGGEIRLVKPIQARAVGPTSIPYIGVPAGAVHNWRIGDRLEIKGEQFEIRCIQHADIAGECKNAISGKPWSSYDYDTVLLDHYPSEPRPAGTTVRVVKP